MAKKITEVQTELLDAITGDYTKQKHLFTAPKSFPAVIIDIVQKIYERTSYFCVEKVYVFDLYFYDSMANHNDNYAETVAYIEAELDSILSKLDVIYEKIEWYGITIRKQKIIFATCRIKKEVL